MQKSLKTHNAPSLKKNAIFYIIYQLVQIGIPILLIPILSGRLKTDGTGNYAFIHSIVLYFSYFALLGVNYYGTRTIAREKVSGETNEKQTFWVIFCAKALTSVVAILGYLIFSFIYWQNHFVLFTQLLFLGANLLDVSWFFSGDENFKSLCIRNVAVKTLSLILIVLFVHDQNDIGIYSLILGGAEVVNQVFMWALLIKKKIFAKENYSSLSFNTILLALKGMSIFFIPQLLIELYTILNTTILGVVWGTDGSFSEVGVFDYANKIVSVLTTIAVSLGLVFLARLSSLHEENKSDEVKEKIKLSMFYSLFISIPLVIGVMCTGHSFVNWFLDGDDWSKVGVLLYFLPLKVIFVAISNTIGVQYLISTGKMKKYIISVACGAVVCIVLNIILVKPLGAIGSAISVVVAEASVTIVQCLLVRKEINVLSIFKKLWKPLAAGATMAVFLAISYIFFFNSINMFMATLFSSTKLILAFSDIVLILAGSLLYFTVLILLREQTIISVLRKMKIKDSAHKYICPISLLFITALVLSVGFYRPYNIRYETDVTVQKRSGALSLDASQNQKTIQKDECLEKEKRLSSLTKDEAEKILKDFNSSKTNGFSYHYNNNLKSIDMISYKFFFFECQDYGTSFDINLRYCLKESEFIKNNIDKIHICLSVESFANKDAPSVLVDIDNSDNLLSDYFKNERRDFIAINGSTMIWRDDAFECYKEGNLIFKDNYYCTISLYFVENIARIISPSIGDADIKQEVWLLNT